MSLDAPLARHPMGAIEFAQPSRAIKAMAGTINGRGAARR